MQLRLTKIRQQRFPSLVQLGHGHFASLGMFHEGKQIAHLQLAVSCFPRRSLCQTETPAPPCTKLDVLLLLLLGKRHRTHSKGGPEQRSKARLDYNL